MLFFFLGYASMLQAQTPEIDDTPLLTTDSPKVYTDDFDPIIQRDWVGTLTYLDYGTQKRVSIACNLEVTERSKGNFLFKYIYPNETSANSKSKVRLRNDGAFVNDQQVLSRAKTSEMTTIVTSTKGKDDNKAAELRFTYEFNEKIFKMTKEVRYEGRPEYIFRNEYDFQR